jgi:hypothetical protein
MEHVKFIKRAFKTSIFEQNIYRIFEQNIYCVFEIRVLEQNI